MEDGGGWMVILRRKSDVIEQVNFNRLWSDYEQGFGDLETEFWYGLHNIHCLTSRQAVDLRIVLKKDDGSSLEWKYDNFRVGGPETNYTLYIGPATAGPNGTYDAISAHNRKKFTTYDRDNDRNLDGNCAAYYRAGWWYTSFCRFALLTGEHDTQGLVWRVAPLIYPYYSHAEMMVRPKQCVPKD